MELHCPHTIDLCILIPCYNNVAGLLQSLSSICYDKEKYVVLIIDDGSEESISNSTIAEKIPTDIYFEVIRNHKNLGITKALNKGLEFLYNNYDCHFIARLDCGDICSADRFYKQTAFLKSNPDVSLLGSWCYFKDNSSGTSYKYITPTNHKQIKRSMHFRNVFIHPTVMWRSQKKNKFQYPEKYPHAEDYGLFYEMISTNESAIIGEFLMTCEINNKGISIKNRSLQLKSRLRVISDYHKNKLFYWIGAFKLNLLMAIPYQFIFFTKKILYKAT